MTIFDGIQAAQLISTIIYAVVGISVFGLAFIVMEKLTPFSIRREIVEGKNVALGVIMASMVIGLSIIIAAAIVG